VYSQNRIKATANPRVFLLCGVNAFYTFRKDGNSLERLTSPEGTVLDLCMSGESVTWLMEGGRSSSTRR